MKYILQIDFPFQGPFEKEMTEAMADLAKDIAQENGLIWKIWTENEATREAGGIYLVDNRQDAERYLAKHTERLGTFGISDIRGKIFQVNEQLSTLCHAKL